MQYSNTSGDTQGNPAAHVGKAVMSRPPGLSERHGQGCVLHLLAVGSPCCQQHQRVKDSMYHTRRVPQSVCVLVGISKFKWIPGGCK